MTKLWIVVSDYDEEGYGLPIGIFSSVVLANECVLEVNKRSRYSFPKIEEYVLDSVKND